MTKILSVGVSQGGKGTKSICCTNLRYKNKNKSRLAHARLVRHNAVFNSPISTTTNTTCESSLSDIESPDFEADVGGVNYEEWVAQRLSFRYWSTKVYNGFVSSGDEDYFLELLQKADRCSCIDTGHKMIVCVDELPLGRTDIAALTNMKISVNYMLTRMEEVNKFMENSIKVGKILNIKDRGKLVRVWTLDFLHNHGVFHKVGYKKRSLYGLIHDPVARQKMSTWMVAASRGNNPAGAKEFAMFVHAHFEVSIKEHIHRRRYVNRSAWSKVN